MLQRREIDSIKKVINALTAQRSYKRKYVRTEEALIVSKVQDLIAKKEGSSSKESKQPIKKVRKERYCRRYSKTSYNTYTYNVKILDADNSNTSK